MAAGSHLLLVLAGISGSGKSFLTSALLRERDFTVIPSLTTRQPRPGEAGSADRHFCSLQQFQRLQEKDQVICGRFFFGNWYGHDVALIEAARARGNAVAQLTYKSIPKFRARYPDAKAIYIVTPSTQTAKDAVLARRLSPEETAERLQEIDEESAFVTADRHGAAPLFDAYFDNTRASGTVRDFFTTIDSLRR